MPQKTLAEGLRIVSLKPNITASLMALGVADQLVGITKFCQKPNVQALVVADYNSIDTEQIIRLKPDLVLGSTENSQQRQYETLLAAKINVKFLDFRTYLEMKTSFMALAAFVGRESAAQGITKTLDEKLQAIQKKIGARFAEIAWFVVIVQRRPLMVASGQTYISTLLEAAGLKNSFAENTIAYPVVDEETLLHEGAQILFEMTHDASPESPEFLNLPVQALKMEDFLAAPQSVDNLAKLVEGW